MMTSSIWCHHCCNAVRPPLPKLNLGTYNIQYGWVFGLPKELQAVQMGNYDIMLLMETKMKEAVYWKTASGMTSCTWECPPLWLEGTGGGRNGYKERPEVWYIESTCFHRPNMVSCEIISEFHRIPLIRAFLPLSTLDHLPYIKEVLNFFLGRYPIVIGHLNANIGHIQIPCNQQVTYFLA